jgi:hypothetical protein
MSLVALTLAPVLLICAKHLFVAAIGRRCARRAAPRPRRPARARPAHGPGGQVGQCPQQRRQPAAGLLGVAGSRALCL